MLSGLAPWREAFGNLIHEKCQNEIKKGYLILPDDFNLLDKKIDLVLKRKVKLLTTMKCITTVIQN